MTVKPQTYWTERLEASDERRHEQQLAVARNLIIAGIEMAFQVTGSALSALEETETAMGAFLEAHNERYASLCRSTRLRHHAELLRRAGRKHRDREAARARHVQ